MLGLAAKARAAGARIAEGIEVTGFADDGTGAVTAVETSAGPIEVEQVVVAVGPWIPRLWEMLGLPERIDVRSADGSVEPGVPMWTYWYLQEGEVGLAPSTLDTALGAEGPVLHVDSDRPLADDEGRLITDEPWGIYVKPDRELGPGRRPAAAGRFRAQPRALPERNRRARLSQTCGARRSRTAWSGSRAAAARTARCARAGRARSRRTTSRSSTTCGPNVYVAADSNHGYKMIAVGREIARVLGGEHSSLLHPFRFERFATGDLHPVSHSPYPWS